MKLWNLGNEIMCGIIHLIHLHLMKHLGFTVYVYILQTSAQ